MTDSKTIRVEIAPGELIDKITILEIKAERITDRRDRGTCGTSSTCSRWHAMPR